jgi:hypothetical protein
MADWGLLVACCVIATISRWLKTATRKPRGQLAVHDDDTSGTFGKMREATETDLEKGGLI